MWRIKEFSDKTLTQFTIDFTFNSDVKGINIQNAAELVTQTTDYPNSPDLFLIPRRIKGLINLGPLTFWDEKKINSVEIGSNFTVFTFKKYDRFYRELPKILNTIDMFNKYVELPSFNKIVMTYVDEFKIPASDSFKFNDYFTLPSFENPHDWKLDYKDIFVGFVPFQIIENSIKKKMVFRLKGKDGGSEDLINFTLDSVLSIEHTDIKPERESLDTHLTEAHDILIHHFILLLNANYRQTLGLNTEFVEK